MPARLESNNSGMLATFWRGMGDDDAAKHWAMQSAAADRAVPTFEPDNSKNYAPALLCGLGDWDALDEFCGRFDSIGWQIREFNSPLYTGKVYGSLVIAAAISRTPTLLATVRRWTALLALQNVWAPRKPKPRKMDFGGVPALQRFDASTPLWMPPTGIRANALSGSTASAVLAVVLGFPWEPNPRFDVGNVPRDRSEWTDDEGAGLFATLAFAVREAIGEHGTPISGVQRGMARAAVRNGTVSQELIDELGDLRLHRGLQRFVIERDGADVLTAWEGRAPTTQKPSVPAARIVGGEIDVLAPSRFIGSGATQCESSIGDRDVQASGDQVGALDRLDDPDVVIEFRQGEPPSIAD